MKLDAVMLSVGIGVGAVGCAAETSAPPDQKVGQTSQALTNLQQSQRDAQTVLSAIFAGDLHGLPTINDLTGSCSSLRYYVSTLESDMAAGYVSITNNGTAYVDGLPAVLYEIQDSDIVTSSLLMTMIAQSAAQCFFFSDGSSNVANFLVVSVGSPFLNVDPGPAQLTQDLSATRGSSAAATDSTGVGTTAWQWPSSPSTGGSFAGGEPCSSVALSAGQATSASILKSGSQHQYSQCK